MAEDCILYDRDCIDCGECEMCDLDEGKRCDDCGKCLGEDSEYRTIDIQEFIIAQDEKSRRKEQRHEDIDDCGSGQE